MDTERIEKIVEGLVAKTKSNNLKIPVRSVARFIYGTQRQQPHHLKVLETTEEFSGKGSLLFVAFDYPQYFLLLAEIEGSPRRVGQIPQSLPHKKDSRGIEFGLQFDEEGGEISAIYLPPTEVFRAAYQGTLEDLRNNALLIKRE